MPRMNVSAFNSAHSPDGGASRIAGPATIRSADDPAGNGGFAAEAAAVEEALAAAVATVAVEDFRLYQVGCQAEPSPVPTRSSARPAAPVGSS